MQSNDELKAENARLQVELAESDHCFVSMANMVEALQSELTKARELLEEVRKDYKADISRLLWNGIDAFLAHQSAPAAKDECTSCDGSGEYYCSFPAGVALKAKLALVAATPDLVELREYHAKAAKESEHYADDSGLRESDVKHYRKRAEFHAKQVALIDSLIPIKQ